MSDTIRTTREGALVVVSLNRPERMNALDGELMSALRDCVEAVAGDPAVRAVLLRGEGRAFCAGGDVPLFKEHLNDLPELIVRWGRELHFAIFAMRRMDKPVLAAVHGAVAGAGMSLMLAADLAIAADDTKFTLAYANIGTNPDGGSTFFLPRLVGHRKAMELALLPDRFDAQTAHSLGLVNRVVAADRLAAEALQLGRRLACGPTRAYAETKRLLNRSLSASMESQMEEELLAFARCARTADLKEGITAFVEKRPPTFIGS
ncbi:MAG TPA: enoyl-CoA hydratase-related protein [Burkholderiales bacterium]|jgi:2-(1,2-epoxy-1,2-dihydrophenyl)acetyl-CoA isomerase|nr:enoyl-CoA hydratase-related protein [Burkholderiales bacterium]